LWTAGQLDEKEVRKMKALLALSDPSSVEALCEALAGTEIDLEFCSTLSDLREVLQQDKVSMVFCQARLPDGTFRDLLRFADPRQSNTAVVVCSDFYDKSTYIEAMSLGAYDYIAFPYRQAEVEWIVGNAMHKGAMTRPKRRSEQERRSHVRSAHAS
jgi:DNA-binding NtrC family response regulator